MSFVLEMQRTGILSVYNSSLYSCFVTRSSVLGELNDFNFNELVENNHDWQILIYVPNMHLHLDMGYSLPNYVPKYMSSCLLTRLLVVAIT